MIQLRCTNCSYVITQNYSEYYEYIIQIGYPSCTICRHCLDCGRSDECICSRCYNCLSIYINCCCIRRPINNIDIEPIKNIYNSPSDDDMIDDITYGFNNIMKRTDPIDDLTHQFDNMSTKY